MNEPLKMHKRNWKTFWLFPLIKYSGPELIETGMFTSTVGYRWRWIWERGE